jgi:hypothetical protein
MSLLTQNTFPWLLTFLMAALVISIVAGFYDVKKKNGSKIELVNPI